MLDRRSGSEARRQFVKALPFVATVITVLALDQLADRPARGSLALLALGLVWFCGLWLIIAARRHLAWSTWPPLLFLVAIVLLRHAGGGSTSGWGPLVLLPVFAASMYGTRRQSIVVLLATAPAVLVPIMAIGGSEYPISSLKSMVLLLSVAMLIEGVVMAYRAALRQEREELALAQRRWQELAEVAIDAHLELTSDGTVIDASESISRIVGVDRDRAIGSNAFWAVHPSDLNNVRGALLRAFSETVAIEFRLIPDSQLPARWLEAVARPNFAGGSVRVGLRDVTDRQGELERLQQAARHDPLTGVLNREAICKIASAWLAGSGDQVAYAFFVDLDRFKSINDNHGHNAGDQVLRVVAHRLEAVLAHNEHLGRFGGDEFAIVGAASADVVHLRRASQRLSDAVDQSTILDSGVIVSVTGSIGFAVAESGWTAEHLIACADAEMYRHKQRLVDHADAQAVRSVT